MRHYTAGADIDMLQAMLPYRTKGGIMTRVNVLGIFRRRWHEEENHILRTYYVREGADVALRLPGRTGPAIRNQAFVLGLRRPRGMKWSVQERALIEENQHLALDELRQLFPDRSSMSVYHARMKLKQSQGNAQK